MKKWLGVSFGITIAVLALVFGRVGTSREPLGIALAQAQEYSPAEPFSRSSSITCWRPSRSIPTRY